MNPCPFLVEQIRFALDEIGATEDRERRQDFVARLADAVHDYPHGDVARLAEDLRKVSQAYGGGL